MNHETQGLRVLAANEEPGLIDHQGLVLAAMLADLNGGVSTAEHEAAKDSDRLMSKALQDAPRPAAATAQHDKASKRGE